MYESRDGKLNGESEQRQVYTTNDSTLEKQMSRNGFFNKKSYSKKLIYTRAAAEEK